MGDRLDFRFYVFWAGQAASQIGDYLALFTLPAFVLLTITRDERFFGYVTAAETFPALIVGVAGGVILDRVSLRWTIVVSDIARAAAFVVLGLMAAGTLQVGPWFIVVLAFAIGTMVSVYSSALLAFIPHLVRPRLLSRANSRLMLTQQMAWVLGVALAGVVIAAAGFTVAFFLNALTFLVSAASVLAVGPVPSHAAGQPAAPFVTEAIEGFTYLWRDARLRWSALTGTVGNFVVAFLEAVMVLIGAKIFGFTEPGELSTLYIAMGVGGVFGALAAPRLVRRLGLGRSMVWGLFLYGLGFALLTYMRARWAVYGVLFVGFAGLPIMNIGNSTLRQSITPEPLLGRVSAASQALSWAAFPAGALFWTWLADRVGILPVSRIAPMFVVAAAVALRFSVIWTTHAPEEEDDQETTTHGREPARTDTRVPVAERA